MRFNSIGYMTFLSEYIGFRSSVILRPTPVPVPILFLLVPFPDSGFLIFQTPILSYDSSKIIKAFKWQFFDTRHHISNS